MQHCGVFVRGTDHTIHLSKVEASSVFEAASLALGQWSGRDWYDDQAIIEVCSDGKIWRVRPDRVRAWEMKRGAGVATSRPQQTALTFAQGA